MKKTLSSGFNRFILSIFFSLFSVFGWGQIFSNPITGTNPNTNNPYIIGQTVDSNITVSGIGRGTGISGTNANNRYNASGWNSSFDLNDYFYFTITPNSGYSINFSSFIYTGQVSNTNPPSNFVIRSSLDGYVSNIATILATGSTVDLSGVDFQNVSSAITFRIYAWGGSSSTATFSINDFEFNGTIINPTATYNIIYDGNGQTSGSVPTDATNYSYNNSATVLGNTGSLTKTGYTFNGWNTASDGTGTDRTVGSTFNITANTTLYAKWICSAVTPTGTITSTTPACTNTTLSYSSPSNDIYWQTSSTGTNTANPTTSTYNATSSGAYYVREYNGTCWSDASSGYIVTINTPVTITTQPSTTNRIYCVGATATTLSVVASGTGLSYQWYRVSDNSAVSGEVSSTFTPPTLSAGTERYYCIVTGTCGAVQTNNSGLYTVNAVPQNPNGTISGTTPACSSTTLTYTPGSGQPESGVTYYWQTSATGTSTTNNAASSITVTSGATYYVRAYNGNCWSTATSGYVVTINTPATISAHPANASVQEGSNATFSISSSGGNGSLSRILQVSTDGLNWTGVSSSTATNTTLNFTVSSVTIAMDGYQYRILVNRGECTTISNVATLTVYHQVPNNGTAPRACVANSQITLSWTASTGTPTPTGYIVFAQPGTTVPTMLASAAGNASSYTANSNYALANTYTTLGKAVFKGNATSATITGLTNLSQYTFKVVAYNGETQTGWANAINSATTSTQTYTIDVPEVTALAATIAPTSSSISWNVVSSASPYSSGCYEYLVVANQGAVSFVPTGDGSAYSPNNAYSAANQVVYKGTGNSVSVTNLTEGLNYCYKVFVRDVNSNQWSDGTSVCQTTGLSYCSNASSNSSDNGITNVSMNTINNPSVATPSYTDFTSVNTTLLIGENYDLSVKVKTYSTTTSYIKAWIDWNRSGTFDSGEDYDLGTAVNTTDDYTSDSPITITVPSNAGIGNTRMRIISKQDSAPTACTTFGYGEVEDYTIVIARPTGAEINVKGGNISIPSGSTSVAFLNNTQFAATNLNTDSVEKDYTIESLGLSNLLLSGSSSVTLTGANPGDFVITQQPTLTTIGTNTTTTFKIKFHPTTSGTLSAIVNIAHNDSTGDESPYTFTIQGIGNCVSPPSATALPNIGPINTLVKITSGTSLTGATISYNGVSIPPVSVTSTEVLFNIPANAIDGNIAVRFANGCITTIPFDVINKDITSCASSTSVTTPSDIFISEITDSNSGSHSYVELYNGTGLPINLSNYQLRFYNNGSSSYGTNFVTLNNYTLASGSTYVVVIGTTTCPTPTAGNQSINIGGINFGAAGADKDDHVKLMKNVSGTYQQIDQFGTYLDANWSGGAFGAKGANFQRKVDSSNLPKIPFDINDWIATDVLDDAGCAANDYSGIGVYNFVSPVAPTISISPNYSPSCVSTILSVTATEGVVGGASLVYQWYCLAPNSNVWTVVTDGSLYSGSSTENLTISDITLIDGYQYYVQVRENTATCYNTSQATKIDVQNNIWNSTGPWTNGTPSTASYVTINGTYNTETNGALDVCKLTVNSTGNLLIKSGFPVKVKNKVTNNATTNQFVIESDGVLIQVDNVDNTGSIKVEREVTDMDNDLATQMDYVYWSSPVLGQGLQAFSPNTPANRIFRYNEANDRFYGVNLTLEPNFLPAKGYAIRAETTADSQPYAKPYEFVGVPNNGDKDIEIKRSANTTDPETGDPVVHGYNLVGNPYPSNIDFEELYLGNSDLIWNTAYFWTNNTYERNQLGSSYSGNNYAIYNGTGGNSATSPATGSGVTATPDGIIKVGQGFIVQKKGAENTTGTLQFKNSYGAGHDLRVAGTGTFFQKNTQPKNRFWLKLISPNNVVNTQLIGYVQGANNNYDQDYDAEAFSMSSDLFYSILEDKKLLVQGKSDAFVDTDIIPLGANFFQTGNYTIALDNPEGIFANSQAIYLKDNLLNTYTNLKEGNYTFNANAGITDGRFEIVYKPGSVLSTGDNLLDDLLVYKIGEDFAIESKLKKIDEVEIYDASGRLYQTMRPKNHEILIKGSRLPTGLYFIKIKRESTITVKKIIK